MAVDTSPPRRWEELALGVLRKSGALGPDATPEDAEERLRTRLLDGTSVRALYTESGTAPDPGFPGQPPYLRGGGATGSAVSGWDVRQLHDDPDVALTRSAILEDLEHGATSVWLRFGPGAIPTAALADVLQDVILDAAPVVLDADAAGGELARAFLRLAERRRVSPAALLGTLGLDPLGRQARVGTPQDLEAAAALAAEISASHARVRPLVADGLPYAEAGATDTDELGCVIATGIAYLRALTEAGLSLARASDQIEFRLAAGADQFPTIAKLRAARRLWARVTEVSGEAAPMRLHAVSSPAMLTRRDPWVNLLRVTTATFAAGVGGADAVTALPFDQAVGRPDAFARRIARNTLSLLQDESEVARVIDPAGGSWYVEQLGEEVARVAWEWMREIERSGGQQRALSEGLVAARLDRSRADRSERIRRLRDPITGVSAFPDLEERPVVRPSRPAVSSAGLPAVRYAEPFEALRDRADRHLAATGAPPTAFLATLGPLANHTARSTFAANLLAAGGIDSESAGATDGIDEVLEAYRHTSRAVAVICGADADLVEQVAPLARALRAAGARMIALAAPPGERAAEWRADGVDAFLWAGGDAIAALEDALGALGSG